MTKKIICGFGTDIDSVAGWIGSYGGGDSPSDIQRGVFATEVGVPRLLRLFKKYDLKTSFFIPGHSLETFPKEMEELEKLQVITIDREQQKKFSKAIARFLTIRKDCKVETISM